MPCNSNNRDYNKGHAMGKDWNMDHAPGGPFCCDEKTKKAHELWMQGFRDGLAVNHQKNTAKIKNLLSILAWK